MCCQLYICKLLGFIKQTRSVQPCQVTRLEDCNFTTFEGYRTTRIQNYQSLMLRNSLFFIKSQIFSGNCHVLKIAFYRYTKGFEDSLVPPLLEPFMLDQLIENTCKLPKRFRNSQIFSKIAIFSKLSFIDTNLKGASASKGFEDNIVPPNLEQFRADKKVPNSVGSAH